MSVQTRAWFIGEGTLLVRCAELYLSSGCVVAGIASSDPAVERWAASKHVRTAPRTSHLAALIAETPFEYLFSIGNFSMLPAALIDAPSRAALNFHYGPLPEYAGVHVPVWALLNDERAYGVTWHEMTTGIDAGGIARQRRFDLSEDETAAGLTARIFEIGAETFVELLDDLLHERLALVPQDFSRRKVYRRHDRPAGHGVVDWTRPADEILRLIRALAFGPIENPFACAKIAIASTAVVPVDIRRASSATRGSPGTILSIDADALVVATATTPLAIRSTQRLTGERLTAAELVAAFGLRAGDVLPSYSADRLRALAPALEAATRQEPAWLGRLTDLTPLPLAIGGDFTTAQAVRTDRARVTTDIAAATLDRLRAGGHDPGLVSLAAVAAYLTRVSGAARATLPLTTDALSRNDAANDPALLSTYVPVEIDLTQSWPDYVSTFTARQHDADTNGSFFVDICIRYPDRPSLASYDSWCRHIVLDWTSDATAHTASLSGSAVPGTSLITWSAAPSLTARADLERLARGFLAFIDDLASAPDRSLSAVSILDARERRLTLFEWNETDRPVPAACVHELIEAQVRRTPDVTAVIFRDRSFTYDALNQQANALALRLRELGVGPNQVVGVFVERSLEMVVALLGILKAGAAYLPLDPAFPQERLAWMLEDTGAPVIVTQEALRDTLPRHRAQVVIVDLPQTPVTIADPPPAAAPADLAYVIFTSGSTGRPKGVMVEHRQAVNFFIGMDEYLGGRAPGTWLAVTSISFDISVLELFWTLARGFTVVVQEELVKAAGASGPEPATNERGMAFSLFYFSADASSDQGHRYRLLLEGARYADTHGFSGVWTPERHFHAFGGLYPNPAVTSAAVAAVTSRVRVRAGSVVLPLHNPIRVAEEWAVVDHLSGGRVELSFASGWHANDFALMPENYKNRRDVMLSGIETIRRLWSGASVPATNGHGEPIEIKVFPAPLQPTPPFWIAAAGSIDTFRLAGRIGAHLLTNLLGQKIADVATKIAAYRTAWREAGHEGEGAVALMLHTFVGPDLDAVRETVRRPLIDYLKTSTELVKQTRWEFPAFANPSGRQAPGGDVELTDEEIDAMMSHAFDRYFETSGLFGTPEVCLRRVNELKAIGVDEIACLLDFGIPTDTVLAHLPYLKDVLDRSQPRKHERTDYTIAAQIARHRITHLQSTPSLIRTILADEHGRDALARVTTLLVGGEPLPASLVKAILPLIKGELLNMYGPTETTVWSTVARITDADDITIGRPIANTQIYIADAAGQPLPIGAAGELLIGGLGVTRGYWQREDLTSERFVANACVPERGDRLYRTGDLARYRPDGRIECLGRIDYQVKVSGHRIELGEIEAAISTHPAVNQSVVVVRPDAAGEPRLVAYVVPKRATTAERGDVSRWQAVWDETYGGLGGTARALDATFDLSGWRDSYTGEPMAEADMREWVDATASRILELKPARVLEIGCGMGLLVHRVAPAVEHYAAVDFSPMAVARVTESVRARGLTNVTVRAAAADAVDQYADLGPVDLVVINSVAQYFPSAAYLTRVLQQAVTLVRPGGAVFIGDVRSLPLLAAFHLSIELAQAPANMATTELRQRVRERVEHDPELVLAPEYFEQLAADTPAITGVDLQLKRGRAHNEMTRFRYDAWLFVNAPAAISTDVAAVSTSVADLSPTLASAAGSVIVRGLVNPRLTRELAALRRLGAPDSPETVGELRHEIGSDAAAGVEPEELVAQAAGWIVDVRWAASGAPGEYDATFRRPGQPRGVPATTSATRTAAALAHEPPQDRGQLVQSLKQHLRQHLPPYMVPGVFVSLEVLPLTPNGKVDRKALPEPDRERQATTSSYVAPTNDFERVIAETWQEILALDRVGVHDNFFDIGANSLLMVQAHAALREKLARPISLVDLFRFPTVGTLAGFLSRAGEPAESAALTASEARAQARLDALSRRRQGRQAARPSESTSR